MKIKWLGHSSFLITSDKGLKIITDPYSVGGGIQYGKIRESADIVTVSHKHGDHDNVATVKGKPVVVDFLGSRNIKGIDFEGIPSYHDAAGGRQRGKNTIFCFTVDGIKVCHLGDLGQQLDSQHMVEIGKVDVLLVPIGGHFTIDAEGAHKICNKLKPKIAIPMHYKTEKCEFQIAGVEEFITIRIKATQVNGSEVELDRDRLPSETETVILQHAL